MYAPYTAADLVRVMEVEVHERHKAAESRRRRLLPATELRVPVRSSIRARVASLFARFHDAAPA